jgi:hypothetical protein
MREWSGLRRRARAVVVIGLAATTVSGITGVESAGAAGASYNWLQCHEAFGRYDQGAVFHHANGLFAGTKCGQAISEWGYHLKRDSAGSPVNGGRYVVVGWDAPPGTRITGFGLDFDMRTADHHIAQLRAGDTVLHQAPNAPGGFINRSWGGFNVGSVGAILFCNDNGGCPASPEAHAFIRNVSIELTDVVDPSLHVGGPLIDGGWKRGTVHLAASSTDAGAGVYWMDVQVNGTWIGAPATVGCNGQTPRYTPFARPCGDGGIDFSPNTAAGPFRNGDNTVHVVSRDFPGNHTLSRAYTVKVDNLEPSLAFADAQDPEDPELIRAPISDEHSGIAEAKLYMRKDGAPDWQPLDARLEAGELRARVDSARLPAGTYEFKAMARDVAGNLVETTSRRDGQPMKLAFPLRAGVRLESNLAGGASRRQTVRYGTDTRARGQLLDADGRPLPDKPITVVEHFGDGALIRERVSHVTTDSEGRWASKVPAGPTRRVEASFAGTPKYLAASDSSGKFTVKSRASFRTSGRTVREGETLHFAGKVGHHGARIPSGGKLLELQVRLETGRWDTVGHAFRTDDGGRYRRSYEFGKHYVEDASFRFRVKVQKEGNWPYKRGASKQRRVIVRAR